MTPELWRGSNLGKLVEHLNVLLGRDAALQASKMPVQIGIGAHAEALAASPPRIVWVDGDDTDEEYSGPREQPDDGKAIWDVTAASEVVIRGADVRRAEILRDALIRALDGSNAASGDEGLSRNVYGLGRARRMGGRQSEGGFTIVLPIALRWPIYEQEWIQASEIEAWAAEGQVTEPPDHSDPETIVENEV